MSARTDMRRVIRDCQRAGLTYRVGGKHGRIEDPTTGRFVVVSLTPSCPHAYKHAIADVRRYLGVSIN
jgi:hypothetical protein